MPKKLRHYSQKLSNSDDKKRYVRERKDDYYYCLILAASLALARLAASMILKAIP